MKKAFSRLISILVIMALCISLIPSAFAAETGKTYSLATTLKDGDQVILVANGYAVSDVETPKSPTYLQGKAITATDDKVVTDDVSIVWTAHLDSDGNYSFTTENGTMSGTGDKYSMKLNGEHTQWELCQGAEVGTVYLHSVSHTGHSLSYFKEQNSIIHMGQDVFTTTGKYKDNFPIRMYVLDEDTTTEEPEAPKSIKILAIGNSFSTDCMQYLYQILQSGGVEEIVLGNLYYGGCSLEQHLDFATNNAQVYTYYKKTTGGWSTQSQYTAADAIADEEWDYISLQQTSKTCGLASSYGDTLTSLVDYVEQHAPNAKLVWNMTWAYQQDSTHTSFPNYNNDQMTMYNMIIDCVNTCILPESRFDIVIPCMTSIQNARTSFLGDTLTRDGYHMDLYIGRYIAALTWYCALTGRSPETVSYNPSTGMISDDMLAVARESVTNAMKTWDQVTPSQITEGELGNGEFGFDPDLILNPEDFYEADRTLAAQNDIDLSKYQLFTWEYEENGYWKCTGSTSIKHPTSGSTYHQNVCTKVIYSIEDIPAGSIFICDDGWQYRPEIFEKTDGEYTIYSGKRPDMIYDNCFVLTKAFLNGCQGIAWNISSNPKLDISSIYAQAACHVRVYVPVQEHEHVYGEWVQTTAPDCTHPGEQQRVCECGEIERQTIPATGHTLTEVAEIPATTQSTGVKKHWKCSGCGKLYSDAEGTTEVSETDLVIPKIQEEDMPKTGDTTGLASVGLVLLLSAMSLAGLHTGKKHF